MAEQIAAAAKKVTGKNVGVNFIHNPRVEQEDTEYDFENEKFLEVLGEVKYPNMFESRSKAMDVAWGLYEGYNEEQVRRHPLQARPRGWRLPSVLTILKIKVPGSPYKDTLPRGYKK